MAYHAKHKKPNYILYLTISASQVLSHRLMLKTNGVYKILVLLPSIPVQLLTKLQAFCRPKV